MKRRDFLRTSVSAGLVAGTSALGATMNSAAAHPGQDWRFERVAGPYQFSEGPVWDGKAVLFTDIPNNRIMRYEPGDGSCEESTVDTRGANGLALDEEGRLYACQGGRDGRRVVRYEPEGGITVLADQFEGKRLNSPNDLAIDSSGRIWFTDPRYGDRSEMDLGHESVYRVQSDNVGDWSIERMTFDTTRPNGILVTPDLRTLYVAQSDHGKEALRELRAYPIQADGTLGEYLVLHDFGPHRGVDGMTFDSDLNIVATAGSDQSGPGPMIYVFSPTGRVLETHPVPSPPTNCTFGDKDRRSLYVTVYDGSLYRTRTDREGYRTDLMRL